MISDVVQQFCQQCGLSGFAMEEGGSLSFTIEDTGTLQLIHQPPFFLVGLSKKVDNLYLINARKILMHAHYRENSMKPLHTQLHEDTLGLHYIFGEREITSAMLSEALDSLTQIMDRIFQGL